VEDISSLIPVRSYISKIRDVPNVLQSECLGAGQFQMISAYEPISHGNNDRPLI